MFETKVLMRIFVLKRNEIMGVCSYLHNVELHNVYFSPDIIRIPMSMWMRLVVHAACMGEAFIQDFVRQPEGKRP